MSSACARLRPKEKLFGLFGSSGAIYSPWRWQLLCLSKRWKTFNIWLNLPPKVEVIHFHFWNHIISLASQTLLPFSRCFCIGCSARCRVFNATYKGATGCSLAGDRTAPSPGDRWCSSGPWLMRAPPLAKFGTRHVISPFVSWSVSISAGT
jgi:hypothetical protein